MKQAKGWAKLKNKEIKHPRQLLNILIHCQQYSNPNLIARHKMMGSERNTIPPALLT